MSLTQVQKEIIENALSHLLDFPDNAALLILEINKLKEFLFIPLNEHDEDNKFYKLAESIIYPEHVWQNLEELNEKPTYVSDIKSYIIDLLTSKIESAAKNIALEQLAWNPKEIKSYFIKETDAGTKFVTIKTPNYNADIAWDMIKKEGKMFQCSLRLCAENKKTDVISLDITLDYLNEIEKISILEFDVSTTVKNPCDYITYLSNLIPNAYLTALSCSADKIYEYIHGNSPPLSTQLTKAGLTTKNIPHYQSKLPLGINVQELITDDLYVVYFLDGTLTIDNTCHLADSQIENLLDTRVKDLIKKGVCTFDIAKNLKGWEIGTAWVYCLMEGHQTMIETILGLSREQAQILNQPIIHRLIKQNRLQLSAALQLPTQVLSLLKNNSYQEYFFKNNFEWEQLNLLERKHYNFLLLQPVINAIKCGEFQLMGVLKLSDQFIETIASLSQISEWVAAGIFKLNEIKKPNLVELNSQLYAKRLYAIVRNSPFTLNQVQDTLPLIIKELPHKSEQLETAFSGFLEKIAENFLRLIKSTLFHHYQVLEKSDKRKTERRIQEIIFPETSGIAWTQIFSDLIVKADEICKKNRLYPSTGFRLFKSKKKVLTELEELCVNLKSLTPFIHAFKTDLAYSNGEPGPSPSI